MAQSCEAPQGVLPPRKADVEEEVTEQKADEIDYEKVESIPITIAVKGRLRKADAEKAKAQANGAPFSIIAQFVVRCAATCLPRARAC